MVEKGGEDHAAFYLGFYQSNISSLLIVAPQGLGNNFKV